MTKIKRLLAKGAATHFIGISFLSHRLLETRGFLHFMDRIFSRVAPSYDRLGGRLAPESVILGPLRESARSLPAAPGRILDLACGTGLATFALREIFPESRIVGADLSERMVRTLRKKAEASGPRSFYTVVCNSGQLPFKENCFDLVLTQNAPPYLEEMLRVLRPGGKLVLAYSFVFMGVVRGVVARRLSRLDLEEVAFLRAEEGMAVTARKPVKAKQ